MKKIKTTINSKNKYELIIQEEANKGDIIDLKDCNVDWINIIETDNIKKKESEYEKKILELKSEFKLQYQKKESEYEKKILELKSGFENEKAQLRRERSNYNIKLLGEDLEQWCNNEVQNQILLLENVSWYKDNEIINKTKGDFIYKIYPNENKLNNELLTSVMLEMKTEDKNQNSEKKQKNENHFRKLDINRKNKNLEFAVLISELEWEQENDLPIRKVNDYKQMFIVRPPYLIIFLSIVYSLAMKYKKIIEENKQKKIEFQDKNKIMEDFEKFKNEILDNSLANIKKNLVKIIKENKSIKESADNILKSHENIDKIINITLTKHYETIINKINNFKIIKIIKKI